MSAPQHIGDLIFPCPVGHLEIEPQNHHLFELFSSGSLHLAHVAFTKTYRKLTFIVAIITPQKIIFLVLLHMQQFLSIVD